MRTEPNLFRVASTDLSMCSRASLRSSSIIPVFTRVPTRSPETIRSMFASSFMLKTLIGRWLSMHSDSAVESITFRPRWSASRAVISGMNSA